MADRGHLHALWSTVAPSWGEHADVTDDAAAPLTKRMLELTAPRPGERVLELACGAGGLGLAAAELVGPTGEVVLSDVAPEMVQIAAERAAARGATNATAKILDLEDIAEPDASYDVVVCREGLMFALDPSRAFAEIARLLRPDGRFAAAVWGPRDRNPWLGTMLDAVSAHVGAPIPPPGIPGPFALDDDAHLRSVLAEAGLGHATVDELPFVRRFASFDEWWDRTRALAGPLSAILANMPADAIEAIRANARDALGRFETAEGLELPAVTLLVSYQR
jgi:SAM-dependent methyltransferase